jgi:hypothetical protein
MNPEYRRISDYRTPRSPVVSISIEKRDLRVAVAAVVKQGWSLRSILNEVYNLYGDEIALKEAATNEMKRQLKETNDLLFHQQQRGE